MKLKQQALAKMRNEQSLVLKIAAYEGKYTKAIPSTFHRKELPAHDARKAENIHHTGSHYVMGSTKAYLKGARYLPHACTHARAHTRTGACLLFFVTRWWFLHLPALAFTLSSIA